MRQYSNLARCLSTLDDVNIPAPKDKYALIFNGANETWEARPVIQATFNTVVSSPVVSVAPNSTALVFEYTLDLSSQATLMLTDCHADGLGEMTIMVNGLTVGVVSNSYLAQGMSFIQNIPILGGNVIQCYVANKSFQNESNSYSVWLYLNVEG